MAKKPTTVASLNPAREIKDPFDRLFRLSMQERKLAIELLSTYLPPELVQTIDFSTLTLLNGSTLLKNLRITHSDCVYGCTIKGQEAYIILACEHQSTAKELMAFRCLKYIVGLMDNYSRQNPGKKLPIILPIVLYVRPEKSLVMSAVQEDTARCAVTCTYQAMRSRKQLGVKRLGQCTSSENIRPTLQRVPKTASINAVRGLGEVIGLV